MFVKPIGFFSVSIAVEEEEEESSEYTNEKSIDFDGGNDYIDLGNDIGLGFTTGLTISVWVKFDSAKAHMTFVGKYSSKNYGFGIYNSAFYANVHAGGSWGGLAVSNPYTLAPINQWHHCVMTWDGSTIKLYVNGSEVGSQSKSGSITPSTNETRIGMLEGTGSDFYFNGRMDEVGLWNTGLSPSQVNTVYNAKVPNDISSLNPVAWYRMGDGDTYPYIDNSMVYSHRSLELDGINAGVTLPTFATILGTTNVFSVSLWVNPAAFSNYDGFIGSSTNQFWGDGFGIGYNSGNANMNFWINGYGNTAAGSYSILSNLGKWVHIVGVYDGTLSSANTKIYINGVLGATTDDFTANVNATGNNIVIGRVNNQQIHAIAANFDEVAIWDTALTSGNVTTIYNSGVPANLSSLSPAAWWRMGDGDTYPTLLDSSTGSTNGTMTNMAAEDITNITVSGFGGTMVNMAAEDIVSDAPGVPLLLNSYGGASLGYSLRKINANYTGSCIQVRRSNDNALADIGFDADGVLDIAALTAHCSSNDGFVRTWYDQSGNGDDATQTTNGTQPYIVSSGSLKTSNGKATLDFNSAKEMAFTSNRDTQTDPTTWFVVYQMGSLARQGIVRWGGLEMEPGANAYGVNMHDYGTFAYGPNSNAYWTTSKLQLSSWVSTGTTVQDSVMYYNGFETTSSFTYGSNANIDVGGAGKIGKGSLGNSTSKISEIILYPNSQATNRIAIDNNINAYYSIYTNLIDLSDLWGWWRADLGAYSDAGSTKVVADATVQEWYDQSGKGHHLTQPTTNNKPQYKTAQINNLPAFDYDGDTLTGSTLPLMTGFTVFTVFIADTGTNYGGIVGAYNNTTKASLQLQVPVAGTSLRLWSSYGLGGASSNNYCNITVPNYASEYRLVTGLWSGGTGFYMNVDGVNKTPVLATDTTVNNLADIFQIGRFPSSAYTSLWFNGRIAEVLWYQTVLTDAEILKVETHLNDRYSLY